MPGFTSSSGVSSWPEMADWLADSLAGKPVAFILELGPQSFINGESPDAVICAQVQVLDDGVLMLRRSRTVLGHLLLADYSSAGLTLDLWHNDGHFDDCTDGYIFSRDTRLIADIAVTWFRENWAAEGPTDLGCDYRFPDHLRPQAPEADGPETDNTPG